MEQLVTGAGPVSLWLNALLLSGLLVPSGAEAQRAASANHASNGFAPAPAAAADAPVVLRGVTVIDVRTGQRMPSRTVVLANRHIRSVTSAAKARVPKGARVVDARGKFLIPGLWDMHVHPYHYTDIAYPLFIANGVTGVRDAGSGVPLAILAREKREIAGGHRVGPRLLISGPQINEADSGQTTITSAATKNELWAHAIMVPRAMARYVVDSLKAAGADFIKPYEVSRAMYFTLVAEARRAGIWVGGHLPAESGADRSRAEGREAADSGVTLLDHGTWFNPNVCGDGYTGLPSTLDIAQCAAGAQHLRRHNTWVTMLGGFGTLRPGAQARARRYLPRWFMGVPSAAAADSQAAIPEPTSTVEWKVRAEHESSGEVGQLYLSYLSRLHQAGVPLLVGSDMAFLPIGWFNYITPGFVVPELLTQLVLAGATPLEALQMGTRNPALALNATDSLGSVEAGKVADLVLLDADPLIDIWNITKIRAVVTNGRYYDRAALDELLVQAERAARRHDRDVNSK